MESKSPKTAFKVVRGCFGLDFSFKETDRGETSLFPPVQFGSIAAVHLGLVQNLNPHSTFYCLNQGAFLYFDKFSRSGNNQKPSFFFSLSTLSVRVSPERNSAGVTGTLNDSRHRETLHVLQDKSAGLDRCVRNTQTCHGTFGKWLLMDMKDDPPCWKD